MIRPVASCCNDSLKVLLMPEGLSFSLTFFGEEAEEEAPPVIYIFLPK